MLAEKSVDITVKVLSHGTRQGAHEYLIELFDGKMLVVGGVRIESKTELTESEIVSKAIRLFYLPTLTIAEVE